MEPAGHSPLPWAQGISPHSRACCYQVSRAISKHEGSLALGRRAGIQGPVAFPATLEKLLRAAVRMTAPCRRTPLLSSLLQKPVAWKRSSIQKEGCSDLFATLILAVLIASILFLLCVPFSLWDFCCFPYRVDGCRFWKTSPTVIPTTTTTTIIMIMIIIVANLFRAVRMCQECSQHSSHINLFHPHNNPVRCHYAHLTEEEPQVPAQTVASA